MILLDTTVLVYAAGEEHDLREPCRRLVAAIGDGTVQATTTVEVLQEFTHVRARRRGREDATALTTAYASLLEPLTVVDGDDLAAGLRLYRDHPRIGAFDAVLAAVAQRRGHLTALVSADRGFSTIDRLAAFTPDDPALWTALHAEP